MNIFKTITDAVSRQKSFDKTLQSKKTFIAEVEPQSKHEKQGELKASAKVGQPSKPKTTARRTSSTICPALISTLKIPFT